MRRLLPLLLLIPAFVVAADKPTANPRVRMETNKGSLVIELFADKAPKTVANFLEYAKSGHYNQNMFHRVIAGFMIQGGGFDFSKGAERKETRPPIANEAANGLKNRRGTLAMARTSDPNSATDQFFINLKENTFLDYRAATQEGYGYCVFGKVIEGMDVVDVIAKVRVEPGRLSEAVPLDPIVIKSVTLIELK